MPQYSPYERVTSLPTRVINISPSVVSPNIDTVGATLSENGIYLVSVIAKSGGSYDHAGWGTWLVNYYNAGSNDTRTVFQIGTSVFSTGTGFINGLTLAAPTEPGLLVATASWGTGGSRMVQFVYSINKLSTTP